MVAFRLMYSVIVMAAFVVMPSFAASITASDDSTISVDVRSGSCRMLSPGRIAYAPEYCGVVDEGAYVIIQKVEHADAVNAVTNTLVTFPANGEGEYSLSIADEGERQTALEAYSPRLFS